MPGLRASLGVAQETVVGTIAVPSRTFEFASETLQLKKTIVQGQGLRAGVKFDRASRRAYTTRDINGGFTMDFPTKGAGILLKNMLGSTATAVQQGATAAYTQNHQPGTLNGLSMTVQKGVMEESTGTIVPFTYNGVKVIDWTIDCKVGGIVTLQNNLDAWNEVTTTALAATAYIAQAGVFNFTQSALSIGGSPTTSGGVVSVSGGTPVASVTAASVKGTNKISQSRYFLGSAGIKAEQIENGYPTLSGQLDAEFVTQAAMYTAFSTDAPLTLELQFVGPLIASSYHYALDIIIPRLYLDGESPKVSGPDVVKQTCGFTALDDQINPVVQIGYTTTDTAV
jgi:Phage tail tube protein